jgi:hypothetical protein
MTNRSRAERADEAMKPSSAGAVGAAGALPKGSTIFTVGAGGTGARRSSGAWLQQLAPFPPSISRAAHTSGCGHVTQLCVPRPIISGFSAVGKAYLANGGFKSSNVMQMPLPTSSKKYPGGSPSRGRRHHQP